MLSAIKDIDILYKKNNLVDIKQDQYSRIMFNIDSICESMSIINGLVYKGHELENNTDIRRKNFKIDDTEYFRVECNFEFTDEVDGVQEFKFKVCVPKLLDGHYFRLYGVDYAGIPSLTNFEPIHNEKDGNTTILIKTLINNFNIELKNPKRRKVESNVKVFTKNVNLGLFLLLVSDCNLHTLFNNVFGEGNWVEVEKDKDSTVACNDDDHIIFKDMIVKITNKEAWQQKIIDSLTLAKLYYKKSLEDREYVIRQLGKHYSSNTNSYLEKGDIVLRTIDRSLDNITAELLDVNSMFELFIKEIQKAELDLYSDSNDVLGKRFNFVDSLLFPLFKRVSENVYIYLNSRRKRIENVFKIREDVILSYISSSELLQYVDLTSAFDPLLNTKISLAPIGLRKENIGRKLRKLHESELGLIDILSSPNGKSAGLSSYIIPTVNSKYRLDSNSIVKVIPHE